MSTLHIAEVHFEGGGLQFRYARKMSSDGSRWVRHGLFEAYHPNGQLASEGQYSEGLEEGAWRDYHDNGQLAAAGQYEAGNQVGEWKYWVADGTPE